MVDLVIFGLIGMIKHECALYNESLKSLNFSGGNEDNSIVLPCIINTSIGHIVHIIFGLTLFITHSWYEPIIAWVLSMLLQGVLAIMLSEKFALMIAAWFCVILLPYAAYTAILNVCSLF